MRTIKIFFLGLLVLTSLAFTSSQNVDTEISVPDSPPELIKSFEDITIYLGEDTTNYLDLDDYFVDNNGDEMNFSYLPLNNISISIDSQNKVTFTIDQDFEGIQQLQFNATANSQTAAGNIFTITIGEDNEPPTWHNPSKDRAKVYQNYYVTFSVLWRDNSDLKNSILSINQGSGWQNLTSQNLTGTVNVSKDTVQVSASPGTLVYWRVYAFDAFNNMNVTDLQNLTVEEFEISEEDFTDYYRATGSAGSGTSSSSRSQEEERTGITRDTFFVDVDSLRISLRQGDTTTRLIKITNTADISQPFRADLQGVSSMAILSETAFTVPAGETFELLVEFIIPRTQMPDEYFGSLIINADEKAIIPIILDVKPFDSILSLEVNLSNEHRFVRAGDGVTATITLRQLQDFREGDAELFYAIKDFAGNILDSANESFPFSGNFKEERTLAVPKGTPSGEYIFYAIAFSDNRLDLDSDVFFVGLRLKIMYYLEKFLYFLIFLILMSSIFYLYLIYKRSKKKKRLLELYLLLNELRSLVKDGKTTKALEIYKRIKVNYNQKVPKDYIRDQERLKTELDKFAKLLKVTPVKAEVKEETKKSGTKPGETKETPDKEIETKNGKSPPKEPENSKVEDPKPVPKPQDSQKTKITSKSAEKKEILEKVPQKEETQEVKLVKPIKEGIKEIKSSNLEKPKVQKQEILPKNIQKTKNNKPVKVTPISQKEEIPQEKPKTITKPQSPKETKETPKPIEKPKAESEKKPVEDSTKKMGENKKNEKN